MAEIDNLVIKISADATSATVGIELLTDALARLKSTVTGGIRGLTTTTKQITSLCMSLDGLSGTYSGKFFGSGMTAGTQAIVNAVRDLQDEVSGVSDRIQDAADEMTKFSEESEDAEKTTGKLRGSMKGLGDSILRVGKMMLIRNALKALVSGFKEGISNLYQWSKALDGHFSHSMDEAASSLMYLKNGIATAVAPALQALIPILTAVTNAFVKALNAIHMFFAALMGQNTITIAKRTTEEYADSLNSAGKAAKKLKDLMGFDEINRLSAPNSGSGGAAAAVNFEDMFETVEVSERMKKLAEILKPILEIVLAIGGAFLIWQKVIKPIKEGTSPLIALFTKIQTIVGNITGTHLVQFLAIALLIVGVIESLRRHWDDFKKGVQEVAINLGLPGKIDELKAHFQPFADLLRTTFDFTKTNILNIASLIGSVLIGTGLTVLIATLNAIITIVNDILKAWKQVTGGFVKLATGDWKGGLKDIGAGILEFIYAPFDGLIAFFKGVIAGVMKLFNSAGQDMTKLVNDFLKGLNSVIRWINNTFGTNFKEIALKKWGGNNGSTSGNTSGRGNGSTTQYQYASGGWPVTGQMFIAREAGPELVGTIGGKTAVATNNDIVAAVSQGVASAVGAVLGGRSSERNISVNVDGRALFDIMVNQNNTIVRQRGASPLLV